MSLLASPQKSALLDPPLVTASCFETSRLLLSRFPSACVCVRGDRKVMTQKDRESADGMKGSDGKVSGNPDEKSQTKLISLR